ncbi:MAG: hypothetical protein ACP5K2_08720 [bacterium]
MNIQSLSIIRNLKVIENSLGQSLERLSSGLRVNRASDDAVIISISSKMKLQIGIVATAIDNLNEGISILRTADGALARVDSILIRVRDLVLRLESGTYTELDKEKYKEEIDQLLSEIEFIVRSTKYNTKPLLMPSLSPTFIKGKEHIENFSVSSLPIGMYNISIVYGGNPSKIALPFRTTWDISLSTSLYYALGETVSDSYTKIISITSNGKTVDVPLLISPSDGDTISKALDKINNTLLENNSKVIAYYDSDNRQIVLASTEVGTRYNLDVKESNSIEGAKYFCGISEVSFLEGPNGPFTYKKLTYVDGYAKGPYIDGGTLVRNYFNYTGPITFTFTGFGGKSLTFNISSLYTLDYASFFIKNQLKTNLGIEVDVTFNSILDRFVFTYSNPKERLEVTIENGIHSEGYEIIEAGEETALGYILNLQDKLALKFLDETGVVATLVLDKTDTIRDILNSINNLDIGLLASYSDGKINIDQSNRSFKIYEVIQEGSDTFYIGKRNVMVGYKVLEEAKDIVFSINGKTYSSDSREFKLDGLILTLNKDSLGLLLEIQFQITPEPIIISLGKEKLNFIPPHLSLSDLGLCNLDFSNIDSYLDKLNTAIDIISRERGKIGSLENTLRNIILTQDVYKQNLEEANSRVLALDIVQEITKYAREKALLLLGLHLVRDIDALLRLIELLDYNNGR